MFAIDSLLAAYWINAMLTPQVQVGQYADLRWGLGWGLQGQAEEMSFWHWGARGQPRTMNMVVGWPKHRQAMIVFTNHADGLSLARDLIQHQFPDRP